MKKLKCWFGKHHEEGFKEMHQRVTTSEKEQLKQLSLIPNLSPSEERERRLEIIEEHLMMTGIRLCLDCGKDRHRR